MASTLHADYRFFLGTVRDEQALVARYATIEDAEQALLFRQQLIDRGLDPKALDLARGKARPRGARQFSVHDFSRSASQLVSDYAACGDPEWLVPNLLPATGLCLFSARPKLGKTLLMENLALEVARGGTWLGFDLPQGRTLVVQSDQGWKTSARRAQRWQADTCQDCVFIHKRGATLDDFPDFWDYVADFRPKLVVMDAAAVLMGIHSEYDNQEVQTRLSILTEMAEEYQFLVILIHHNRKAVTPDEVLVNVRGGSAWTGAADSIIEMYGEQESLTFSLRVTNRDGNDTEPLAIRRNAETLVYERCGTVQDVVQRSQHQKVYALLRRLPGQEAGIPEVAVELGVSRQSASRLLTDMYHRDLLVLATQHGGKGRPSLRYGLPPDGHDADDSEGGRTSHGSERQEYLSIVPSEPDDRADW